MGKDSAISWCRHTFNPWWGCTKVGHSPACDHCYAETFARRCGFSDLPGASQFPIWGDGALRRYFGDKHWGEPLKWNSSAEKSSSMEFVFCASMADWAEGRPEQKPHLERLWKLQEHTGWLIWLMLTKRPQLISSLAPTAGAASTRRWFGTTAETQRWLDIRWPHLRETHSPVYWLSMEPLFEKIKLPQDFLDLGPRAWVIVGGEGGSHARPMHPDWCRYLRDQCLEASVPFHFKQWGSFVPWNMCPKPMLDPGRRYMWADGTIAKYGDHVGPTGMRDSAIMQKLATRDRADAILDGIEWRQFPGPQPIVPAATNRADEFHDPEPEN